MSKVLILYYSSWGHIEQLAQAEALGVQEAGVEAVIKRVPELVPEAVRKQFYYKEEQVGAIASVDELPEYDGIIFGTPTRFGNMASQMRNFLDQTGGLWAKGSLIGKVGGVFTSSASQHFGQETTSTSFYNTLIHHGMVIAGVPPNLPELYTLTEVSGGTPYGASTISGGDGKRQPSKNELIIAQAQGKYIAQIAKKLSQK